MKSPSPVPPIGYVIVSPTNFGANIGFIVYGLPSDALITVRGGIEGSNEEIFKKSKTVEEIKAVSNNAGIPESIPPTSSTFDFYNLEPQEYWFEISSDQTEYQSGGQIISISNPLYRGSFNNFGLDDVVGDDAQLANIDMQNALQKQQQMINMFSNINKMTHNTSLGIIRNIG
jgi:hypothetical protein